MNRKNLGSMMCRIAALAYGLGLLGAALAPATALAWWRGGGVFVGVSPFYAPPPVYLAPPPVYVAPPPVYFAPPPPYGGPPPGYPGAGYAPPDFAAPGSAERAYDPSRDAPPPGRTCYAGSYTCPLGAAYPPGAGCACPTGRGPNAYGRAG